MASQIDRVKRIAETLTNGSRLDAVAIAARSALRALPLMGRVRNSFPSEVSFENAIIAIFRASSLSWTLARYPDRCNNLELRAHWDVTFAFRTAESVIESSEIQTVAVKAIKSAQYAAETVVAPESEAGIKEPTAAIAAAKSAKSAASAASVFDDSTRVWEAINYDVNHFTLGFSCVQLASLRLWPEGRSRLNAASWRSLTSRLPKNSGWDVWIDWYGRRLRGVVEREDYELVFASVPVDVWEGGVAAVNAWIKMELAKLEAIQSEPPPIPVPVPGPHVEIDLETGAIVPARTESIDAAGNHVSKLKTLHPQIRQLSSALLDVLNRSNEQPELRDAVARYRELVDQRLEEIDFDRLWGEGVFLEEAAAAAERRITDPMREPLGDTCLAYLNTLNRVHGPFILASRAGQENLAAANAYELRPEEQRQQKAAAEELAIAFRANPEVFAPETAALYATVIAQTDSSIHPERSAAFKAGAGQNIVVALSSGAAIGTMIGFAAFETGPVGGAMAASAALPVIEGLKKSKPFLATSGLVTKKIDEIGEMDLVELASRLRSVPFRKYRQFVLDHEELLRRFAGTRKQGAWLREHLDWLTMFYPKN